MKFWRLDNVEYYNNKGRLLRDLLNVSQGFGGYDIHNQYFAKFNEVIIIHCSRLD